MSSKWQTLTLDEVCERITDGAHASPKSVENGMPMASVKDLTHFGLDLSEVRQISVKDYEKLVDQGCKPEVGDVIIAKDGNSALDTVCTVEEPIDIVLLSSVAILRPDSNVLDPDFLKYYFCSRDTIQYLKSNFISGAAIPRIVLRDFRKAEIKLPSLIKQKEIAFILKSFDQKIHLNQQTNETLEPMAQAIFKSWFVDFDPVRAKIEARSAGRDPNRAAMAAIAGIFLKKDWDEIEAALDQKLARMSESQQEQFARTAQLFPDELVDSEIGDVPKGWGYSTIGKEFDIENGQSPPGSTYNEEGEGVPFYQGRTDFGFRFPTQRVFCTEPKRFAKKGDTLLSVRAPVGDLNIAIEDCCIGRGLASLRHKSRSISYTFYAMKKVQSQIKAYEATGTVFGSINQKQLKALDTISPDKKLVEEFHRIAEPIDAQIMNQESTNRELSELRDTLLPKLISGELKV